MRPVCLNCGVEFKCKKNGVLAKVGICTAHAGDKYQCPKCGHEIISGWAFEVQRVTENINELTIVDLTLPYKPKELYTTSERNEIIEETMDQMYGSSEDRFLAELFLQEQLSNFRSLDDEELEEKHKYWMGL